MTLQITKHSWAEQIEKLDVTSSGHDGLQALLAGILRGDGSMSGFTNSINLPWNAENLVRAGNGGQFEFDIGTTTPFSVPALITKVSHAGAVDGKMEWTFDVSLSILHGAGVYAYASQ